MPELTSPAMPAPLLRLSRAEAQARTTVAQRAIGLPVRLGTRQWFARLVPCVAPGPLPGPAAVLHFEWAGAVFALSLPDVALQQMLAAELDHALLPGLPAELLQPVLEAALADVLQALQALGRGAPQLVAHASAQAQGALPSQAFELLLHADNGPEAMAAQLHADGLGLLLLAGLLAQRAPQPAPADPALPVRLRAELGCTRVALQELQSLAPGDVVLVHNNFVGVQRTLWLSADGQAGLHVRLPDGQPTAPAQPPGASGEASGECLQGAAGTAPSHFLTVLHPWSVSMPAPSPDEHPDGAIATSLQALPVRLSFDLGEVSLTLAQLQALQPGQVLALGHPLNGAVRIRANGTLVGEGDLVEIDGQLGVSVRTLFGASAA